MASTPTSTIELVAATRPGGGGRTERRFHDIIVDGASLAERFGGDLVTPFGWGTPESQIAALDRLARRAPPDLAEARVSLYVCAECGDLGCGAISVFLDRSASGVIWRDFGFQNNYDGAVDRTPYMNVGPFCFDGLSYHEALARLRRDLVVDRVARSS